MLKMGLKDIIHDVISNIGGKYIPDNNEFKKLMENSGKEIGLYSHKKK